MDPIIKGCPGVFHHYPKFTSVLRFVFCSVTRNYFENLVQALEAGLEDVHATAQAAGTSSAATSSKKGGTKSKKKQHTKPSSDHTDDGWPCERCTFLNPPSVDACSVCEKSRY